jgi:outer membrane protein OmpA-like peptidoglycan-associated protein
VLDFKNTRDVKKLFILLALVLSISFVAAQNIYHPWIISAGTNFADFNVVNMPFNEQIQSTNWMGKKAPTMMRIGRMIKPCLSVSLIYTTVTLEKDKLNDIPLEKIITDSYFTKVGLQAEYRFTNGKLLKDEFFIDPYVFTGFSIATIDEENYPGIPGGFGVNIWPLDYLGLNFQASYEYLFDFNDYVHVSVGITARFGNMIDKDRDMIADRYDACPEIWGLADFDGCPDYDHDGVVDSLDQCPKEHGWAPANGCPDFDKDGVPDKEDACPCDGGPMENNGCPEGMAPTRQIPVENTPLKSEMQPPVKGENSAIIIEGAKKIPDPEPVPEAVPLTDPEPKQNINPKDTTQNQGRTASQVEAQFDEPAKFAETIDPYLDNIHFEENSAAIKASSFASLDKIIEIMMQNPEKSFTIQGYTDVNKPDEYKDFLSKARAKSVHEYFVENGISQSRLEARGFEDIYNAHLNRAEKSQAKKRWVEVYMD